MNHDIDSYEIKEFNNMILRNHYVKNENIVKKFLSNNVDSEEIYKLSLSISKILYSHKIIKNNNRISSIILTEDKIKHVLKHIKKTVYIIRNTEGGKTDILDILDIIKIFEIMTRVLVNDETSISSNTPIGFVMFENINPEWDDLISKIDSYL